MKAAMGVLAVLVLASSTAQPAAMPDGAWTQYRGDAGRTGQADLPDGPLDVIGHGRFLEDGEWLDAEYTPAMVATPRGLVALANGASGQCTWVVMDAHATVLERIPAFACQEPAALGGYDPSTASLYVCRQATPDQPLLEAYDLETLERVWSLTALDMDVPAMPHADCEAPAILEDGSLVVPVRSRAPRAGPLPSPTAGDPAPIILEPAALGASALVWIDATGRPGAVLPAAQALAGPGVASPGAVSERQFVSVAAGDEGLLALMYGPATGATLLWTSITGDGLGTYGPIPGALDRAEDTSVFATRPDTSSSTAAAIDAGGGAIRIGAFAVFVDEATGVATWATFNPGANVPTGDAMAPAMRGGMVFIPTLNTVHAFAYRGAEPAWQWAVYGHAVGAGTIVEVLSLASRLVVVAAGPTGGSLSEVDPIRGTTLGAVPLALDSSAYQRTDRLEVAGLRTERAGAMPTDQGVIAWNYAGDYALLGHAAPGPRVHVSDAYPAFDEPVRVALDGPEGGRVWWGDGTTSPFEQNVEHRYRDPGIYQIRIVTVHGDGTTTSSTATVHPGGTAPAHLNWFQQAAQPENYDLTFGLLGLAIAVAGGLFALARARRRRNRISRELDAIERAAEASSDPGQRTAAMQERRAHVRGLLLDGRIDESQLRILETRIDELARGGRIESMRGRFDFLPHGFVMQVQEMLADGRLSGWEYDQLDKLLAADASLTGGQKKRVRGLLRTWAKEDAG